MTRIATTSTATAYQGGVYVVNTEDGPQTTADWFVGVTTAQGDFAHQRNFKGDRWFAERFAEVVNAAGSIDPTHWTEVEPYNRELEAELDWQAEQDDRRDWGALG